MSFNPQAFTYDGTRPFDVAEVPTRIADLYENKREYEDLIEGYRQQLDELQSLMYAHNRYGVLLIFQAMDAAGKDSTIKHVMSGVNPFGVKIYNFKRPSETELDHDYLWRTMPCLPQRGTISIFNRSYYEEVLVVRVHPEILTQVQKIPAALVRNPDQVWKQRYDDINNFEQYLQHNGVVVMKFFLNISKQEQGERLIERIEDPTKNWKFEEADIKERGFWAKYMATYQDAINATATPTAPWHVIPADDKKNMRLIVSQLVIEKLRSLDMHYPAADATRQQTLQQLIEVIREQDKA